MGLQVRQSQLDQLFSFSLPTSFHQPPKALVFFWMLETRPVSITDVSCRTFVPVLSWDVSFTTFQPLTSPAIVKSASIVEWLEPWTITGETRVRFPLTTGAFERLDAYGATPPTSRSLRVKEHLTSDDGRRVTGRNVMKLNLNSRRGRRSDN